VVAAMMLMLMLMMMMLMLMMMTTTTMKRALPRGCANHHTCGRWDTADRATR
jgi:hypothetical protein